jgi:CRP/FNR family cyclic AMP-dependent transcriptional regulator
METSHKVTAQDLANLDFCANLTDGDRAILAQILTRQQFGFDQVIFRSGEPADACYLVQSGSVALEVCSAGVGCRRLITAGEGELLGWSPFLKGACFTATARALEPSCLLRIPGEELLLSCERNPAFGYHILRQVIQVLASRINASRLQLLDLFGPENPGVATAFPDPPESRTEAGV